MMLTEFMEKIEGRQFDAELNAASGLSVFRIGLEDSEVLNKFIAALQERPENTTHVAQRISDLLKLKDEPQYLHPYDAAIAAYLFALSQVDIPLTHKAIEAILQTPQLWWSRRLAKHLQGQLAHEKLP